MNQFLGEEVPPPVDLDWRTLLLAIGLAAALGGGAFVALLVLLSLAGGLR